MAQPLIKQLTRLAHLAHNLEEKRTFTGRMDDLLKQLERAGVVVTGERAMLRELQAQLDDTVELLQQLANVNAAGPAVEMLNQVEELLSGEEWEFAHETLAELEPRGHGQAIRIEDYKSALNLHKLALAELTKELHAARAVRAPVLEEEEMLKSLTDITERATAALSDQNYALLPELGETSDVTALIDTVRRKTAETRPYAQQAELALLQSPIAIEIPLGDPAPAASGDEATPADSAETRALDAARWYCYTVVLRMPGELGAQGINVQGSSTLVEQDRLLMRELIDKITLSIEHGLTRQASLRAASTTTLAAPAATSVAMTASDGNAGPNEPPTLSRTYNDSASATVDDNEEEPGERETLRRFLFGREKLPLAGETPDPTKLVRYVGDLMYRLLLPEPMQDYLLNNKCSLTITTNDLELPWELMHGQKQFLCLERPVARLPMGQVFPRSPKPRTNRKLRFLLIYADPGKTIHKAALEVQQIEQKLRERFGDRIEIDVLDQNKENKASGRSLNEALSSGRYNVIHYAGHAYFDAKEAELSGLLLDNREVFVSQKIRRLLEGRPFIFLNACQTALTANEKAPQKVNYLLEPASGLAAAFMYGGAVGCIGALWPIYDEPAAQFAVHFYQKVLEGHMFGQAMLDTRLAIKRAYPESITWAAFVLYGNPTSYL